MPDSCKPKGRHIHINHLPLISSRHSCGTSATTLLLPPLGLLLPKDTVHHPPHTHTDPPPDPQTRLYGLGFQSRFRCSIGIPQARALPEELGYSSSKSLFFPSKCFKVQISTSPA